MNTVDMIIELATPKTTADIFTCTRCLKIESECVCKAVPEFGTQVYHAVPVPQSTGYAAFHRAQANERSTQVMDHLRLARGTAGKYGLRKSENFGGLPWPTAPQIAAWKARGIYVFSAHQRGGFFKARRCAESMARSKGYAVLVRSQQYSAWVVTPQIDSHAEGIWGWCHASEVSLPRSPGYYWVRAPKPVAEPADTWEVTYTDPATSCTVSKLMRHHDPVMLAVQVRSELPNVRNLDITYLDRDVLDESVEVRGGSDEDGEELDPIENFADPVEALGSNVEWNSYLMRMNNLCVEDALLENPEFNPSFLWHPLPPCNIKPRTRLTARN